MASAAAYCFQPNGNITASDLPCDPNAAVSVCCGRNNGWVCLGNGMCWLPGLGALGRGTCTDRTWQSPDCPQYCTQSSSSTLFGPLCYTPFNLPLHRLTFCPFLLSRRVPGLRRLQFLTRRWSNHLAVHRYMGGSRRAALL